MFAHHRTARALEYLQCFQYGDTTPETPTHTQVPSHYTICHVRQGPPWGAVLLVP